ncbi:MAG TPA: DUF3048 domain-containing protein [Candidatus Saccharibacteria bacterium]|nr:DUF3048 domain-containing protein [Candidatus Saccharibacteria bacterium]
MRTKINSFVKFRGWVDSHRILSLVIAGILLLILGAGVATFVIARHPVADIPPATKTASKKEEPKPTFYAPLTGLAVDSEEAIAKPVTAIMIENSPDARPQSGIKNSAVVYEAIAEGGITRFLVLYQQEKPQLVGPVRSLRMYYVDWLAPYNASVAHVGGSANALAEIRNGNYRDIDQFFNGGSYWRASERWAPHNVYTSFERLDALNASKGYTISKPSVFARKDSKPTQTPTATSISVTMSGPTYNSSYTYDAASNLYFRSQGGAPHTDREEGQITPRVVIVIKSAMQTVFEDGWRQQYQTTGSGSATIFQDGTVQEVTWHKTDRVGQYHFTDAEGKNVALARGQTWISVVPADTGGVSWQ